MEAQCPTTLRDRVRHSHRDLIDKTEFHLVRLAILILTIISVAKLIASELGWRFH